MDLSIVIVSYDTRELLRRCLESVIGDRWLVASEKNNKLPVTSHQSPVAEIIMVDNGSTDGSQVMLRQFKVQSSKFKVHLIFNQKNLGFAKAVNQGIKSSQGKVILLLNSDTQVKKGALERLLEFEKKVSPAVIGLRMINPDGSVQGSVFNLPTVKRAIEEFWLGRKGSFSKFAPNSETPIEAEAVSGGAMAISKKVIEKIGLLDERYFMYFEDLDYCRRAGKAGYKIWFLPEAEIVHEHGASGKTMGAETRQWSIKSSKIYYGLLKYYLITGIIKLKLALA